VQPIKSRRRRLHHPEKLTFDGLRTVASYADSVLAPIPEVSGTNEGRFFLAAAEWVGYPAAHSVASRCPGALKENASTMRGAAIPGGALSKTRCATRVITEVDHARARSDQNAADEHAAAMQLLHDRPRTTIHLYAAAARAPRRMSQARGRPLSTTSVTDREEAVTHTSQLQRIFC
jgi:hypothetical protein